MSKAEKPVGTIHVTRDGHGIHVTRDGRGNIVRVAEFGFVTPDPVTPPSPDTSPPATPEQREIDELRLLTLQAVLGEYKPPPKTRRPKKKPSSLKAIIQTLFEQPYPGTSTIARRLKRHYADNDLGELPKRDAINRLLKRRKRR